MLLLRLICALYFYFSNFVLRLSIFLQKLIMSTNLKSNCELLHVCFLIHFCNLCTLTALEPATFHTFNGLYIHFLFRILLFPYFGFIQAPFTSLALGTFPSLP